MAGDFAVGAWGFGVRGEEFSVIGFQWKVKKEGYQRSGDKEKRDGSTEFTERRTQRAQSREKEERFIAQKTCDGKAHLASQTPLGMTGFSDG